MIVFLHKQTLVSVFTAFCVTSVTNAQTSPPPNLGEETKGTPIYDETPYDEPTPSKKTGSNVTDHVTEENNDKAEPVAIFGVTKITESHRDNGQRYRIELEHSSGSKQYIEENDSDGKIESTSHGIEETPNLPKWKLRSW